MRQLWKTLVVSAVIVSHVVYTLIARLFVKDPQQLRALYLRTVRKNARTILNVMGVQVQVDGSENLRSGQNYLMVANHMSYLDALIMAAHESAAFVTSIEMKETPVLGILTEVGGCLYVERRSKENIHNEIAEIEEALRVGFHIVIYPEATSTNGEQLRPFKRPLFLAAVNTKKPVLPVVIQYEEIDGEKVTRANRDTVCWYGKMSFGPHFFGLMGVDCIRVRLKVLPEIPITSESTRDTLMEAAFEKISSNYQPIA